MVQWKSLGRVAIFIDYANILHSYQDLGWRIDFLKLKDLVGNRGGKLTDCFFFDAVDRVRSKQVRFQQKLKSFGYQLSIKPLRFFFDPKTKTYSKKGDCDADLAVDAIRFRKRYETMFLFSGDGDYVKLVRYLRKDCKKKVVVFSQRDHVARILIEAANFFVPLDKLKKEIEFKENSS
jgi:uncharacterized LabA/DUF88 family protein